MPTLITGEEVDSASAAWRVECLARYLLAKPLAERRAWLEDLDKKQTEMAGELREIMKAVHAAKPKKGTKK